MPSPEKDFKALVRNESVASIGVDVQGLEAYFCAPMYRFSRESMRLWLAEIDAFVSRGRTGCNAETVLNEISDWIVLRATYLDKFCMEIDRLEDCERARRVTTAGAVKRLA